MNEYQTKQRTELLNYFETNCDRELSISDILTHFQNERKVSRSAIYRNIEKMTHDGLIRKSAKQDGKGALYQFIGTRCSGHLHLQCKLCGKIFHWEDSSAQQKMVGALMQSGFQLDSQKTVLYGTCRDCSH